MKLIALILGFIAQIPGILKLVDETVTSVEAALPTASGSQKLAAATAKVNSYLAAASAGAEAVSNLAAVVAPLINASVAAFNAAGVFKKAAAPTVVPPSA